MRNICDPKTEDKINTIAKMSSMMRYMAGLMWSRLWYPLPRWMTRSISFRLKEISLELSSCCLWSILKAGTYVKFQHCAPHTDAWHGIPCRPWSQLVLTCSGSFDFNVSMKAQNSAQSRSWGSDFPPVHTKLSDQVKTNGYNARSNAVKAINRIYSRDE